MNNYELTVVLAGKATVAKKKSVLESLTKLIEILKGKVGKVEDWGVKDLAYKIRKNEQGLYLHLSFEMEGGSIKQLDTRLKMDEDIIRFLIVKI